MVGYMYELLMHVFIPVMYTCPVQLQQGAAAHPNIGEKEQEKGLIRRPDRLRGPAGPRTPGRPFLAGCGRGSGAWQGDSSAGILFLKILP